jgi:putative phosphoesterase
MRVAIISDIHGNRTAFEAVLADLRETSPDLILHGGDLADAGSSPVEIVDRIRDLGWPGVVGNTDEILFQPQSLTDFANTSPAMKPLLATIEQMAAATRSLLGEERLAWLAGLPRRQIRESIALVHASPESPWRGPQHTATDAELESAFSSLNRPVAVYAHIHRPLVRRLPQMTVVNTGSVGLSYDGNHRASYLLLDDSEPSIRRVDYDVDHEIKVLASCGLPHSGWIARILRAASPQMP